MSDILKYARRELRLAGYYDHRKNTEGPEIGYNRDIPEMVLALIGVFASQDHNQNDPTLIIDLFKKLASEQKLSALTDHPGEWQEVTEDDQGTLWQSNRDASCFSRDWGKTYYDSDEEKVVIRGVFGQKMYTSKQTCDRKAEVKKDIPCCDGNVTQSVNEQAETSYDFSRKKRTLNVPTARAIVDAAKAHDSSMFAGLHPGDVQHLWPHIAEVLGLELAGTTARERKV